MSYICLRRFNRNILLLQQLFFQAKRIALLRWRASLEVTFLFQICVNLNFKLLIYACESMNYDLFIFTYLTFILVCGNCRTGETFFITTICCIIFHRDCCISHLTVWFQCFCLYEMFSVDARDNAKGLWM